jgi:four helix bundle protein
VFDALRNLEAWRRSCRLSVNVIRLLENCPSRILVDQLSRSSLSIASNLAEGYARETGKDRLRFLVIAKGSCTECWTQLLIGAEARLIEKDKAAELAAEAEEIAAMIAGLIKYFRGKIE